MKKLLYVFANPKAIEHSASLTVGEEFLNKYKEVNPNDVIEKLDLYKADLADVDYDVMAAFGKLAHGVELNDVEKAKLAKRQTILDQFLSADKIVIATPMWELSYPAPVKVYLDTIIKAGVTFKYSEEGMPIGLVENKKALLIHASGGIYEDVFTGPFGLANLKGNLNFIGINEVENILIQGTAFMLDEALKKGKEEAKNIAEKF